MIDVLLDRLKTALAGRYRVERELGRGGMATVYLAEDLKHHRRVAVKVLRPETQAMLGAERFLREIETAARLNHPNILPLHDSGEADGFAYYVMPYVEGESLRDRLNRETQLPLDEALQIAREVADALAYAHSHDVVHRDIKPENILMGAGHALVSDFGIARAISAAGAAKLTETGLAVGTPAYMSPEQLAGGEHIDGRTDVYSLGSVLYEMLAGEPPFTGPTAQAIQARKLTDPVPRLRTVRDTVPDALDQAITKALARNPADRFATAHLFAEALERARAPGAAAVPMPPRRRVRPAAIAATVLVLARGGLVGVPHVPSPPRRRNPHRIAGGVAARQFHGRLRSGIFRRRHDRGPDRRSIQNQRVARDLAAVGDAVQSGHQAAPANRQRAARGLCARGVGRAVGQPGTDHGAVD